LIVGYFLGGYFLADFFFADFFLADYFFKVTVLDFLGVFLAAFLFPKTLFLPDETDLDLFGAYFLLEDLFFEGVATFLPFDFALPLKTFLTSFVDFLETAFLTFLLETLVDLLLLLDFLPLLAVLALLGGFLVLAVDFFASFFFLGFSYFLLASFDGFIDLAILL
jgi:hypothetical protein